MKKFWLITNPSERNRLKKEYKKIRRLNRLRKRKAEEKRQKYVKIDKFKKLFKNIIIENYKPSYERKKDKYILEYKLPKVFSLRDNYDESFREISKLASLCDEKILKKANLICINMSDCEVYDLDASCILDSVMDLLKDIAKSFKTFFNVTPPKPINKKAYFNFITTGFVNDPDYKTKYREPVCELRKKVSEKNKIKFVDFNKNKTKNLDLVVTDITDMILDGFDNSKEYELDLGNILGEIIDNIKEHSGNDHPWYITGNLIPNTEYNKSRIELVIMNYGLTFSDTLNRFLNDYDAAELYPNQFNKIKNSASLILAKQKNFFGKDTYTIDQIYTYILLQQGISSKIKSDDNKTRRGRGIIKLLESIEKISDSSLKSSANMILYSGDTCIKFLNKYKVSINNELNKRIKAICLNDENSLFSKIDKKAVIKESVSIPGTMIYLNFDLKEELDYEKL